jgi:hypothetical protein
MSELNNLEQNFNQQLSTYLYDQSRKYFNEYFSTNPKYTEFRQTFQELANVAADWYITALDYWYLKD